MFDQHSFYARENSRFSYSSTFPGLSGSRSPPKHAPAAAASQRFEAGSEAAGLNAGSDPESRSEESDEKYKLNFGDWSVEAAADTSGCRLTSGQIITQLRLHNNQIYNTNTNQINQSTDQGCRLNMLRHAAHADVT